MIHLVSSIYRGPDRPGDFAWMIRRPEHDRSLFIYNENIETHCSRDWSKAGAGNACVRPYRAEKRAIGVPTGSYRYGGFRRPTRRAMRVINEALDELTNWLRSNTFERVIYSADNDGLIGCGIFDVSRNVRQYITDGLRRAIEDANRSTSQ